MEFKKITVGPLTSINNLVYHLSKQFLEIRTDYLLGKRPTFKLDFSDIKSHSISLPALASLLSVGKKLSEFIGYPIPVITIWEPHTLAFLHQTQFIQIAKKLNIFSFEGDIDGWSWFTAERPLNPNTKLLYFGDVKPISHLNPSEIGTQKALHKQKLISNLKLRCSAVFNGFDDKLENTLYNTLLELIVNSLMHGQEFAFVALQRSSKGITIAVCDSGIGFKRSLMQTFSYPQLHDLKDEEAILIGSLIQKEIHGLRLAISEVLRYRAEDIALKNEGWVTISSYGAEIRWQKRAWHDALNHFEKLDLNQQKPRISEIFDPIYHGQIDEEALENGYCRTYNHFLVGTRISFEIKF